MEPKNPEKSGKSGKEKIVKLTCDLKKYDDVGYSREREAELDTIVDELAAIGSPAVPELIGMLSDPWQLEQLFCRRCAWKDRR